MSQRKTTTITTTNIPQYSAYLQQLKPESFSKEKKYFQRFFTLNSWQYLLILAIAISGLAAFINTYDAWSNINSKLIECTESDSLRKELNTQFIIIIVLSCIAIVIGVLLAWFFRRAANQRRILTLGIITAGIFGILYALSIKFRSVTNKFKLGVSWLSFIFFIILGFFLSSKDVWYKSRSLKTGSLPEETGIEMEEIGETDLQ